MNINFGYYGFGRDRNEYDLTCTDGPSGTFVRRISRRGSLVSTDTGTFSPNRSPQTPPGNPGGASDPDEPPPGNPSEFAVTLQNHDHPVRPVFRTDVTGIAFDDSAPSDFADAYVAGETMKFPLVVRYKVDRWDEVKLTFANGVEGAYPSDPSRRGNSTGRVREHSW